MREITIEKNDANQRLDRFMAKYLPKAPKSLINKYIRLKKIKINKKRSYADNMLIEGDKVQIYVYDEVLEEYEDNTVYTNLDYNLDIVYEDENIALINKPVNILSHAASKDDYGNNIVDNFVKYLIKTKQYIPRLEKSFIPALSNRLDRNTSGLLIGCKNKNTLNQVNEAIKYRKIEKYYLTICKGYLKSSNINLNLDKDANNRVKVTKGYGKESLTKVKLIKSNNDFSLVDVDLITGRTHQIRVHLKSINHPIVGDRKYGDAKTNKEFRDKYNLNNQLLHSYKIVLNGLKGELNYLNGKIIYGDLPEDFKKINRDLFGESYENLFR